MLFRVCMGSPPCHHFRPYPFISITSRSSSSCHVGQTARPPKPSSDLRSHQTFKVNRPSKQPNHQSRSTSRHEGRYFVHCHPRWRQRTIFPLRTRCAPRPSLTKASPLNRRAPTGSVLVELAGAPISATTTATTITGVGSMVIGEIPYDLA